MDDKTELKKLLRTNRDIIAISSLPSIWVKYDIPKVAESLVETLTSTLSLEFSFLMLKGQSSIVSVHTQKGKLSAEALEELTVKLSHLLTQSSPAISHELVNPWGDDVLYISRTPIGNNFSSGVLITASRRQSYPTGTERLILNIASNQTYVNIQHKWTQEKATLLAHLAEEARSEAVKANELKSSFLANMSHEIRTPLGAILGFTELLKKPNISEDRRDQYFDVIIRSGKMLSKIIDDILDLSKVEAGKLAIENIAFPLTNLCQEVILMFSDVAKSKGVSLTFDASKILQLNIYSDPVRVRQVLVNLVGNAVKFTSEGSVKLNCELKEADGEPLRIVFSISDTGIGLSKETAENLFQPFHQGDNSTTRKFGGTGLGLALSKKLGFALGGDVRLVECGEGKGCTFEFEFLAKKVKTEDSIQESLSENELQSGQLVGYRILVADDSNENRLLIETNLSLHGASVELAVDGEEAVNKILDGDYDIVLMDIQMPKLDGYGSLDKLKKHNYNKPILALTAHAMKEDKVRALTSGFADHVSKPINIEQLVQSIVLHAKR